VTTAGRALARRGSRQQLLWVALALSLALNLFFVAGALWTRFHAPQPLTREQRFEQMAAELALDPQQRQAFAQYAQAMRGRLLEMHRTVLPLVRAAWSEVAKPQADEAKVMRLLDQADQTRRNYRGQITAMTIAFLDKLSPAQRAKFVAIAHQGPPPWAPQFPGQRK